MIKHVIALILGLALGAIIALALLYFNPLAVTNPLSPVSVSDKETISLEYSAVAQDSIMYTNDGESRVHPHPVKVHQVHVGFGA